MRSQSKPAHVGMTRQTISWECVASMDVTPAWSLPAKRTYTHYGRNGGVGRFIWHMKCVLIFATLISDNDLICHASLIGNSRCNRDFKSTATTLQCTSHTYFRKL